MGNQTDQLSQMTTQQIGELPQDVAKDFISSHAREKLMRAVMTAALVGAGGRGVVGIIGNMRRNLQRKRDRDVAARPVNEITLPIKAASDPIWYPAALATGTTGALAGGWMGTGALMKRYRKARSKQELEKAKREFEDALSGEHQLKFSADLSALAKDWEDGALTDELLEKASWSAVDLGLKGYLTLAAAIALAGGGIGWKMVGNNPEAARVKAYREAMRRRQSLRPVSLVARSKAIGQTPQDEDTEDDINKMSHVKQAQWIGSAAKGVGAAAKGIGRAVKGIGRATGISPATKVMYGSGRRAGQRMAVATHRTAKSAPELSAAIKSSPGTAAKMGLGALGMSWLGTNTAPGRRWMGNRAEDLMQDPAFIERQTQAMLRNPQIMSQIYQQMMPQITQQMIHNRPVMGRLMAYLLGTHGMNRRTGTPQQYYA